MRNIKIYLSLFVLLLIVSCADVEDFQQDPNRATEVTPDLLLTNLETAAFNNVDLNAALASRHMTFIDDKSAYQYYNWQREDFAYYDDLKNVRKMTEEAKRLNLPVYETLAKFFNSYFYIEMTRRFGDIPFTNAIQAEEGTFKPEYNSQPVIYKAVLDSLKFASQELSLNNGVIRGDIIYDGDKLKWRKLINSYRLRVLVSLSNKVDNSEIDIIGRFSDIINSPDENPLFEICRRPR